MLVTYDVKFNGSLITLPKTKRDFLVEKRNACLEIIRGNIPATAEQVKQATRLYREIKVQLDRK